MIVWAVYLTHFFATPVLAAVLWKIDRQRFRRFVVYVATLSFAGLATYALYPAAPPWMAAQAHLISPVTRIVPLVWQFVGVHSAGSTIEHGYAYANNVAAVPSLHAAFSLLDRGHAVASQAQVAATDRGAVSARDGLLARLRRRALRLGHPARLALHDRRAVGGPWIMRWWAARRAAEPARAPRPGARVFPG